MRHRRTKRRSIGPWNGDQSPEATASRARYVGSPEHKSYSSSAGPPALRSDATPCDPAIEADAINAVLQEAIRRRCTSARFEQGFPKYAWGWLDGSLYEARHINGPAGTYKGYQLTPSEYPRDPETAIGLEQRQVIRFRMEWQDAPGVTDAVVARTWCRLAIDAGGHLVTQAVHGPSESLRGGVYGSAFPLCQWLVENWWFLLNEAYRFPARYSSSELAQAPRDREWVQRHSLLAAQEGYALPDLTLFRDEQRIVARWMPDGETSAHPALRFVAQGETQVNVADAERGVAEAIQAILERLEGINVPEVVAVREDWMAIESATEQERRLCEWAARLGLDPYDREELTDDMENTLRDSVAALDAPLRHDFLDAAQPQTVPRDLDWLREAEALAADAGAGRSPEEVSHGNGSATAHGFGYACATTLRRRLLPANVHDPIDDLDGLLVRLGWAQRPSQTLDLEAESPLEAALTRSNEGAAVAIVGDAGLDANRFRLARSAFLHHFAPSGRAHRRLVTEAHTWEQRASRAFAAEFLAPAEGLARHLGRKAAPRQTDALAHRYGVSAEAIRRQIENHRLAWPSYS